MQHYIIATEAKTVDYSNKNYEAILVTHATLVFSLATKPELIIS